MTQTKLNQLLLNVQATEAAFEDAHDGYGALHPHTIKAERAMEAAQAAADAASKVVAAQPYKQTHVCIYSNSFMNLFLCTKRIMAKRQVPARQLSGYGHAIKHGSDSYLQIDSIKRDGDRVTVTVNDCHGPHTIELGADEIVDMAALD